MKLLAPALAAVSIAGAARAQFLLAPEPANDDVLLFSAVDGSLINPTYIDLSSFTPGFTIEAIQVNNEIWISEQTPGRIFRFSLDGTTHLGTISGGLNNIRGMVFDGTRIYVTNAGTGTGAPGQAIVMLDVAGANLGSFPVINPFDVVLYQGDLLISNITGHQIDRYTTAGVFVSTLHDSDGVTGIDFPQQIAFKANGNLLVGGFSPPSGIYEYDPAGTQVFVLPVPSSGGRGVTELGNGSFIFSATTGVNVYDPVTTITTNITLLQCRYFSPFTGVVDPTVPFCTGDNMDPNVTTPCPCFNPGAVGNGCANSVNAAGANLTATGIRNPDSMVLVGTGMPATVSCIYLQGDAIEDVTFGDGVRCAGGTLIRLRTKANVGGASSFPDSTDTVSLSVRGGVIPGSGAVRYYQTYYRNSAALFCPPETFNVTNGFIITW